MPSIISVENLSKKYLITSGGKKKYGMLRDEIVSKTKKLFSSEKECKEDFWALKNISFEVNEGDRVGIIGRNGAGKSTLLKILSRITEPTEGIITLRGKVASLLEIGTGFHPELTGTENIYFNGSILGMTRNEIKRKFDEIVAFAEVEQFLNTPLKRYSSGMYLRLAFAVAAHLDPEVLIIDEVLAVGDAAFQRKCLKKMDDISKQGKTILFVSHNISTISSLCDSVIFIKDGRLVKQGDTDETIKEYLNENQQIISEGNIPRNLYRRNNYTTGEAYIEKLLLQNSEDKITNEFYFGEPIKFIIEVSVEKKIESSFLQIILYNQAGERILSLNDTNNSEYSFKDFEVGHYQIETICKAKLLPADFSVSVFIANQTGTPIDFVENISPFSVSKIGLTQNTNYPWGSVHGFVEINPSYTYNKIS